MTDQDIRSAFGETPDAFRRQVDETLMQLEEGPMKKRYKISTMLIAAILAVTLLAGAAIAATGGRAFRFLQITPLNGVETRILAHAGSAEDEYLRLDVEEAIFDGEGLLLQCRITPKQAGIYNLGDYTGNYELPPDPGLPYLLHTMSATVTTADGSRHIISTWRGEVDDGSLISYGWLFAQPLGDTIDITITLQYTDLAGIEGSIVVPVSLKSERPAAAYVLTPDEFNPPMNENNGIELSGGRFTFSEAFGHYEIDLLCDEYPVRLFGGEHPDSCCLYIIAQDNCEYPLTKCDSTFTATETEGVWRYTERGILQPFAGNPNSFFISVRRKATHESVADACGIISPAE